MSVFYVPAVNLIGRGVINEFGSHVKELGFKKSFDCYRPLYCIERHFA